MNHSVINNLLLNKKNGQRMPVIFMGHGSPMNAIDDNRYTRALHQIGTELPVPAAILCISAHWMTEGTWVTHMEHPRTIHDFYGFPQELFDVQYPAPGSPELAELVQQDVKTPQIHADDKAWGLDHGTWSVLKHMYPAADIPVVQLSLDMTKGPAYHFELAQQLKALRERGVLILGSGNIVHNLRQIRWEANAQPHDWALEFDQWMKTKLEQRDFHAIQHDYLKTAAGRLANPSQDHYYPLLYTLGASLPDDNLSFIYEEMQNASLSMRSVRLG